MKGWPGEPQMQYNVMVAEQQAAAHLHEPITDVVFDFGNVLITWDPQSVLKPRYAQDVIDAFLDNDISGFYDVNDRMDAGVSQEEAIAWMRETHGEPWASILEYYIANFEDSLTGVVPGARVLVQELKSLGIGVWGLSNWEKELFPIAYQYCPILQQLQDSVVSGNVGLRKPHADIYEYALRQFGINAATSVFIDDKAMNIVGANAVGMRGIRLSDMQEVRAELIRYGVPLAQPLHLNDLMS